MLKFIAGVFVGMLILTILLYFVILSGTLNKDNIDQLSTKSKETCLVPVLD